jgi:phosphoglycolate phosphatase
MATWDGERFRNVAAVLFDLDGTLVESRIDFAGMRREVLRLAAERGVGPAPLEGLDILEMVARAAACVPDAAELRLAAEAALTEIEVAACPGTLEMPGALELLRALEEEGIRVGIVTRNCRRVVTEILGRIPLPHGVLLTRDEVTRVKPDPEHLLLAASALGVAPARVVMVGDHRMDVRAGRAAGMGTVGLLGPERPADYFDGEAPDRVVCRLSEIRDWISPSSS